MRTINTKNAPGAIGPYSQGYIINNMVFTSGQIPVDPKTGTIEETIVEQAKQSCLNVGAILKEARTDFSHVFKTTCFLADMDYFKEFNEIYSKYFVSNPARSCVAVKELPKGVLCEIEAIAILP